MFYLTVHEPEGIGSGYYLIVHEHKGKDHVLFQPGVGTRCYFIVHEH